MRILIVAALLALPAVALAQEAVAPAPVADAAAPAADAATTMAAPAKLPRCTAKVQDSCDQSQTSEKNALSYYPADSRDAGNNKIAGAKSTPPKAM